MDKQILIVEIEANEESIGKLLSELEERAESGEFDIRAVTLRKDK